jgi:hypothetical protein
MNYKKYIFRFLLVLTFLFSATDGHAQDLIYTKFIELLIREYLIIPTIALSNERLNSIEALLKEGGYSLRSLKILNDELSQIYKSRDILVTPDYMDDLFQRTTPKRESHLSIDFIERFQKPKILVEATFLDAWLLKEAITEYISVSFNIKNMEKSAPIYLKIFRFKKQRPEEYLMQNIVYQLNKLAIRTDFFHEGSWKFLEIEEYFNGLLRQLDDFEKKQFQRLLRLELMRTLDLGDAFAKVLLKQDTIPEKIITLYYILQSTYFKNSSIEGYLKESKLIENHSYSINFGDYLPKNQNEFNTQIDDLKLVLGDIKQKHRCEIEQLEKISNLIHSLFMSIQLNYKKGFLDEDTDIQAFKNLLALDIREFYLQLKSDKQIKFTNILDRQLNHSLIRRSENINLYLQDLNNKAVYPDYISLYLSIIDLNKYKLN